MRKSARRIAWEKECAAKVICPDCFKDNSGDVHICRAKDRNTMKHLGDVEMQGGARK